MPGPARLLTRREDLERVYAELLHPSFPPEELLPLSWLVDGTAAGRVRVLALHDDDGPAAVAVTERLEPSRAVLLAYFATRRSSRGAGVGSRLYRALLDDTLLGRPPSMLLAEVERPDRHTASVEHGDPEARLRFYARHGARVLDLPYFQPPIGPGAAPVHGMLILALWVDPALVSEDGQTLTDTADLASAMEAMLPGADDLDAETGGAAERLRRATRASHVRILDAASYAEVAVSDPPSASSGAGAAHHQGQLHPVDDPDLGHDP